ncbi:MAG: glycosyltransferase family 4 protein [Acidimicrobiales bacterium]
MTSLLMTADTVGGVWTYALELAEALAPLGVRVPLATMGPPLSAGQRAAVEASAVAAVHEGDFALEWTADPWDDVDRAGRWLLDLEDRLRPDVVHLNGYAHGALAWRAPTVVVAHSCVLSWWDAVQGEPAPAEWDQYRRRVTEGLRAAGVVVAPTAALLAELSRWYGLDGGQVIANGRRSDRAGPVAAKEDLILGGGRLWDEAKNLALLNRVAPRLRWPVAIAGDPRHPVTDETAAAPGGSRLLGRLEPPEMAGWLLRASIFVLPARYEPFGLGPLEAALAGCALVLGDIPSLREVWETAALYVGPDDDAGLVQALNGLISDAPARAELAGKAWRRALELSPDRMAAAYHRVYTSVTATHGVSA